MRKAQQYTSSPGLRQAYRLSFKTSCWVRYNKAAPATLFETDQNEIWAFQYSGSVQLVPDTVEYKWLFACCMHGQRLVYSAAVICDGLPVKRRQDTVLAANWIVAGPEHYTELPG